MQDKRRNKRVKTTVDPRIGLCSVNCLILLYLLSSQACYPK